MSFAVLQILFLKADSYKSRDKPRIKTLQTGLTDLSPLITGTGLVGRSYPL